MLLQKLGFVISLGMEVPVPTAVVSVQKFMFGKALTLHRVLGAYDTLAK